MTSSFTVNMFCHQLDLYWRILSHWRQLDDLSWRLSAGICCWGLTSCLWMPSWWLWRWCSWRTSTSMRCSVSWLISSTWWGHTHIKTHLEVQSGSRQTFSCLCFLSLRVTSKVTSPTSTRSLWSVNRIRSLHSPQSPRLQYPQSPLAVTLHRMLYFPFNSFF